MLPAAGDAVRAGALALEAAGCDTPRLDAEILVADALGIGRGALLAHPERALSPSEAAAVGERLRRRKRREPVAYVLGRRGFRWIELEVDPCVLIPRPESELLVEEGLRLPAGARVHDVGTGSGAVALALKHERPDLAVSASDLDPNAVALARRNAGRLGLEVPVAVAEGLPAGEWDLVLANLPYVSEGEWERLAPEIRHWEPRGAVVAGDGLTAIRALVEGAPPDTRMALEHAEHHGAAVRGLLRDARTRRDLAGRERVTAGWTR
jgi:release factor glutamine methyltransferase